MPGSQVHAENTQPGRVNTSEVSTNKGISHVLQRRLQCVIGATGQVTTRDASQHHRCKVTFAIDDDEGGEILHVYLPHRLHAELWVFQHFNLF